MDDLDRAMAEIAATLKRWPAEETQASTHGNDLEVRRRLAEYDAHPLVRQVLYERAVGSLRAVLPVGHSLR